MSDTGRLFYQDVWVGELEGMQERGELKVFLDAVANPIWARERGMSSSRQGRRADVASEGPPSASVVSPRQERQRVDQSFARPPAPAPQPARQPAPAPAPQPAPQPAPAEESDDDGLADELDMLDDLMGGLSDSD